MSIPARILHALSFGKSGAKEKKFGTFLGVYVPTILMLFGVIVFLRIGWVTGQAGLGPTLFMITFSALISLLTLLSLTAIATNIEIGKGGVYYVISRSLGIEAGCAVGIPLYLRQTLSVTFNVIGFSESLHALIPSLAIPTIGIATLIALASLAYFSLKGALKIQVVIFIILIASFVSLFFGRELAPSDVPTIPSPSLGFWALFAILFPAMTGVESSISLSGDLKRPSFSLPVGTIAALLTAYAIYFIMPIFLSHHIPMDRLASDPHVLKDFAKIPSFIILGIWGATLSSALGSILGAPRTLQALAEDGVVPRFFGKTSAGIPTIATLLTFGIALVCIYFGSVNVIAPILTIISLICYFVLNCAVGLEALMANPSWRPRFRTHWSISFIGAILCLFVMLMIGVGATLISFLLIGIIFVIAKGRDLHASWEDLRVGLLMYFMRQGIYTLTYAKKTSKSWRPHFIAFAKGTQKEPNNLVHFAQGISQSKGFLTMSTFVSLPEKSEANIRDLGRLLSKQLKKHNVQAIVQLHHHDEIETSITNTIEHYGLGPLKPNTLVFGSIRDEIDPTAFAKIIKRAYHTHHNIILISDPFIPQLNSQSLFNDIHIWWNDTYQDNSEFMLVLGYMLQQSPAWRKARLCVKAIAHNENERDGKEAHFKHLSVKKRLPWNTEIFLVSEAHYNFADLVKQNARQAGIIFTSLRPPHEDESDEAYAAHIKELSSLIHDTLPTVFVLTSEHTPLDNILQ